MYNIATLNKISPVGLAHLSDKYTVVDDVDSATGILVRSQDMHEMDFSKSLMTIARAGAGVNNIPLDKCADQGIVVFNTPGANANAVKELVLAGMLMSARNVPAAIKWAATLEGEDDAAKKVEKGKGQFAGTEIAGKTLGVFGLGAIGVLVANAAAELGMNVIGYDAFFNTKSAHSLCSCVKVVEDPKDMLPICDYVTIHVPAMDATKGMFNKDLFAQMKDGVTLLNYSRDKLVNEADLLAALDSGKIGKYTTDFVTDGIMCKEGVTYTPHLGASTAEAEDNCATMAVAEIMDYVENGNVVNSVNFPKADLGPIGETRVCVMTKGVENPVDAVVKGLGVTVKAVAGGAKGDFGYVLVATDDKLSSVPKMDGTIKVRVIQD
ncbi:3-phosphoglycerate dehydrogenase [Aminicella lysinilytica]|uniref:3-phosphoglycerate dehydrogenase n=1 Tax=Aminicella lysinilytica TaxID=433323 RepID=UPI0026EA0412|nr:3-phosphoglycerate dehydrogenase [Aminicella lysinilytica]